MKKNNFKGWKNVYTFYLVQSMKQKSYIVTLIIMCVLLLASVPLLGLIQGMTEEKEIETKVTELTVYDQTGLNIEYKDMFLESEFSEINVVTEVTNTFEDHLVALEESDNNAEIIVTISLDETGYFQMTFAKAADGLIEDKDASRVAEFVQSFFSTEKIKALDISEEQMELMNREVRTKVEFISTSGEIISTDEESGSSFSLEEYNIILGVIVVVVMIIAISGSSVATSIVTEKTTRVVEYIMISIRPMALLIGKILSALTLVLIQFASMIICYLMSAFIFGVIIGKENEQTTDLYGEVLGLNSMEEFIVVKLIFIILMILAGILFYGTIAGLAGASVSKMEEMTEGLKTYNFIMIVGSYIGIGLAIMGISGNTNEILFNIACILPISSPFVVPANVLIGKVSPLIGGISLLVLIISIWLLLVFASKVYESMIYYNGTTLKLKDVIKIAKSEKQAK